MKKKDLIINNDVNGLSQCTFEQHLTQSKGEKSGTYTDVLTAEEEVLLIEAFLQAPDKWQNFVKRYLEHYLLTNRAIAMLIEHVNIPAAAELVNYIFTRYGHKAEDVELFIKQNCGENVREQILQTISTNVRMFEKEVFQILERYDINNKSGTSNFAETYRSNVPAH